jgi:hypothetical protein
MKLLNLEWKLPLQSNQTNVCKNPTTFALAYYYALLYHQETGKPIKSPLWMKFIACTFSGFSRLDRHMKLCQKPSQALAICPGVQI